MIAAQAGPGPSAPSTIAGTTPARHSDDLPTPESPATITIASVRSRSISVPTSRLRPKNIDRWLASNGRRPRYGLPVGVALASR